MLKITHIQDNSGNVTGRVGAGGKTDDRNLQLNGSGSAGETINIYDNGQLLGQTTVKDDGSWCFNCQGLNHGEHNFSASGAGANPIANLAITVDPNASNIDLPPGTIIYDGGKIDNNTPTIEGWA
ncbi:MAG: Ig-like domain-containing protein, partial [Cellvibrionaceae bacterium]|nr:Ig-like domain-containing protein [Cellvibrionaceae bacterium]